jgi:hypothetical protein
MLAFPRANEEHGNVLLICASFSVIKTGTEYINDNAHIL